MAKDKKKGVLDKIFSSDSKKSDVSKFSSDSRMSLPESKRLQEMADMNRRSPDVGEVFGTNKYTPPTRTEQAWELRSKAIGGVKETAKKAGTAAEFIGISPAAKAIGSGIGKIAKGTGEVVGRLKAEYGPLEWQVEKRGKNWELSDTGLRRSRIADIRSRELVRRQADTQAKEQAKLFEIGRKREQAELEAVRGQERRAQMVAESTARANVLKAEAMLRAASRAREGEGGGRPREQLGATQFSSGFVRSSLAFGAPSTFQKLTMGPPEPTDSKLSLPMGYSQSTFQKLAMPVRREPSYSSVQPLAPNQPTMTERPAWGAAETFIRSPMQQQSRPAWGSRETFIKQPMPGQARPAWGSMETFLPASRRTMVQTSAPVQQQPANQIQRPVPQMQQNAPQPNASSMPVTTQPKGMNSDFRSRIPQKPDLPPYPDKPSFSKVREAQANRGRGRPPQTAPAEGPDFPPE